MGEFVAEKFDFSLKNIGNLVACLGVIKSSVIRHYGCYVGLFARHRSGKWYFKSAADFPKRSLELIEVKNLVHQDFVAIEIKSSVRWQAVRFF